MKGLLNIKYTLFSDSGSIFLIFWRFEAENILKIFLEYRSIEYVCQYGVAFLSLQMIAFIHCATFWYIYCTMYHDTYISSTCYFSRFEAGSRCHVSRLLDILASKKSFLTEVRTSIETSIPDFVSVINQSRLTVQCSKTFLNQQGLSVHEKCIHGVTSTTTKDNPAANSSASGAGETEKQIEGAVRNTVEKLVSLVADETIDSEKGKSVLIHSSLFNIDRPRARCYTGSPKHVVKQGAHNFCVDWPGVLKFYSTIF